MIIRKIEIENFRSYYKSNSFELINGLNLIIGSNGDGKTTLFEALEWLFRTDGTMKMDTKLISQKRIDELEYKESDNVRVAMIYEHKGNVKTLEKTFRFTKTLDGNVGTSNYSYIMFDSNDVERIPIDGNAFDFDLPSDIRRYTMFKGESNLDVFVLGEYEGNNLGLAYVNSNKSLMIRNIDELWEYINPQTGIFKN